MPEAAAPIPIFDPPTALPRGPHGLSREEVAASQRSRLLVAFTELLAERGYAAVTIGELARRANVSRATFYQHFADKEACLLAAYDHFASRVIGMVDDEVGADLSWREFIDRTVGRYLATLEADPTAARAFFVEMEAAGAAARRRRREAMHVLAGLFARRHAAMRAADPTLAPLPDRVYLAIALGIRELIHDALESEAEPRLRELEPDVELLVRSVVEGAAAARRSSSA